MSGPKRKRHCRITDYFHTSQPDSIVDLTAPSNLTIDLTNPGTPTRPRQNRIKISENKSNRWTNQKNFHKYKNIPTPRLTTYNTTSYSHDQVDGPGYARQAKLISNLDSLAIHSDFVLTQETNTNENSPLYRKLLKPRFKVFNNPNTDKINMGGTDVHFRLAGNARQLQCQIGNPDHDPRLYASPLPAT